MAKSDKTKPDDDRASLARRVEQRDALLHIIGRMNSERNLPNLLKLIAQEAARILSADRTTIFLHDRHRGQFYSQPALGEKHEILVPVGEGIVGFVAETGEVVNTSNAYENPHFSPRIDHMTGYRTGSILAVPLRNSDGEIIGVFEALNSRVGFFNEEDQELLMAFASHAAIALDNARAYEHLRQRHREAMDVLRVESELIGDSPVMKLVREQIARIAPVDTTVLLLGDSGTGKELAARAIHTASARANRPLVCINCAALAETLLESELFGHVRGAFTGAVRDKKGKFEVADGGTIFLDEVGEMSLRAQTRLLRILEQGECERVGSTETVRVDVRVVAATNADLKKNVAEKTFREDLYFRLRVIELRLPKLREHPEDIPMLARHFLKKLRHETGHRILGFTPEAIEVLKAYHWPGNVRQLRNAVERAMVLCNGPQIGPDDLDLPQEGEGIASGNGLPSTLAESEKQMIIQTLKTCKGKRTEAAKVLGIDRTTLYRKMRKFGIS